MRREKVHERKACKWALEERGVPNVKLLHPGGETGWPDRLFFIPGGRILLIEFKEVGYEPEPRQVYVHNLLRALGYEVETCDSLAAAKEAIDRALATAPAIEVRPEVSSRTRRRRPAVRPRPR